MRSTALIVVMAMGVAVSPPAVANPDDDTDPVGPKLPPKVRGLLLQEMNAVNAATQDILDALVRGKDPVVAQKAQAIHDSFILKQEMTASDRQALRETAPEAFLQRDRAFHELTGELAEAARQGDRKRQRALFADMIDACAECHGRYATNRFNGFAE